MSAFKIKGNLTSFKVSDDGKDLVIWFEGFDVKAVSNAYSEIFLQLRQVYSDALRIAGGKAPAPAKAEKTAMPLSLGGGIVANEEAAKRIDEEAAKQLGQIHQAEAPAEVAAEAAVDGEANAIETPASVPAVEANVGPVGPGDRQLVVPQVAARPPQPQSIAAQPIRSAQPPQPIRSAQPQPHVMGTARAGDPNIVRGSGRAMVQATDENGTPVGPPLTDSQVEQREIANAQAQGVQVNRAAIRQPPRAISSSAARRPPGPPPQRAQMQGGQNGQQAHTASARHVAPHPARAPFIPSHERMGLKKVDPRKPQ